MSNRDYSTEGPLFGFCYGVGGLIGLIIVAIIVTIQTGHILLGLLIGLICAAPSGVVLYISVAATLFTTSLFIREDTVEVVVQEDKEVVVQEKKEVVVPERINSRFEILDLR